ncbi:MAG: hypothetical protein ACREAL_07195 [Nitrosopumilaceae archaeon]
MINSGIGDVSRLTHIKNSIVEKKKVYNSDIEYVESLVDANFEKNEQPTNDLEKLTTINCPKCENTILPSSNYCSFCGIPQQKYFDAEVFSSRFSSRAFPFRFHLGVNFYQLLAILGGLTALAPSLVAVYTIDRILVSLESYTGRDLSGFTNLFIAAGIATGVLCIFAIAISFLIKKPKKVGKILFFISFMILGISLGVGVVGFALIMLAGIIALQRRHY